jgi:hypothetical protein
VSRLLASREANAPGTRLLISELFEADRELINALFDPTLDVIEAALQARDTVVVKGALVDGGPDHYPARYSHRPRRSGNSKSWGRCYNSESIICSKNPHWSLPRDGRFRSCGHRDGKRYDKAGPICRA